MYPTHSSDSGHLPTCGLGYFVCYIRSRPETLRLIPAILADDLISYNLCAGETDYQRMSNYFIDMWLIWESDPAARTHRFKNLGDRVQLAAEQAIRTLYSTGLFDVPS